MSLLAGNRSCLILLQSSCRQLLTTLRQWLLCGLLPVYGRTQHGWIAQRALHRKQRAAVVAGQQMIDARQPRLLRTQCQCASGIVEFLCTAQPTLRSQLLQMPARILEQRIAGLTGM